MKFSAWMSRLFRPSRPVAPPFRPARITYPSEPQEQVRMASSEPQEQVRMAPSELQEQVMTPSDPIAEVQIPRETGQNITIPSEDLDEVKVRLTFGDGTSLDLGADHPLTGQFVTVADRAIGKRKIAR